MIIGALVVESVILLLNEKLLYKFKQLAIRRPVHFSANSIHALTSAWF